MPKPVVFFVTPELQQVLDGLPKDEPRSRLEPFRAFILRWRREGRTYRRIRSILRDECRVTVSLSTLFNFVERRSKPRKPQLEPEIEQPLVQLAAERVSQLVMPTGVTSRRSPEEIAADRAALRAAYDQPLFPSEEKKPLFVRRPGPIRNLNNEREL